jgi:hypothetical protein
MRGPLHLLFPLVLFAASCISGNTEGSYDTSPEADADTDADADADTDSDSDSDICEASEMEQPGTNLCWSKCPYGATFDGTVCQGGTAGTWSEALGTCGNVGNGSNVPGIDQMVGLLGGCDDGASDGQGRCEACSTDCGKSSSETCTGMFFNDNETYWTNWTIVEDNTAAIVEFCTGLLTHAPKDATSLSRCAREAAR